MIRTALFSLLIAAFLCPAEETYPWKLSLESNLTASFNYYSDNWAGEEVGALSWATSLTGTAEKQFGPLFNKKTTLKLAFGQTKTENDGNWSAPRKTTDLIDLEILGTFNLGIFVDPYLALHGVSQFLHEWEKTGGGRGQRYGNPWELTESFGIARKLINKEPTTLSVRFGGAARQLIDRRWEDSMVVSDGGLELIGAFSTKHPSEVVTYTTRLACYEALFRADANENNDDWRYPDINWENTFTVNLTQYIMINWQVQLLYDREVDREVRLKNTVGAGLTVNLANYTTEE